MVEVRYIPFKDNGDRIESYINYVRQHLLWNKEAINNLDFLLQKGYHVRASGRSTLIALALIVKAKNNPGKFIEFEDHYPNKMAVEYTGRLVYKLLDSLDEFKEIKSNLTKQTKLGIQYK